MGMAGGVLLSALTGVDYHVGMLVITAVCVGYTLLGGLRAVIGTDFIQCVLILVGLVVVAVAVYSQVGLDVIHAELAERRPALLDLLMPAALIFLANNALFGLGEVFHSNVWWSRAFAFREGVGMRAFVIAGVAWLPVPLVAGSIALAAPALDLNVPALDMVGPAVVGRLLGSGGALLILVVVFASLASSLDSLLAATSDLLVEDVYRGLMRPDADEAAVRRAGHAIVIGLGVLCVLLCWPRLTTLAELIQLTGALVASTIWPIVAGVYWRTTNRRGAALAMVAGSVSGLVAYFTIGFYAAALVGAAASMIVVVGSTLAWPEPFDWGALRGLRAPAGVHEGGAT
jgi:Na+/proline symporter